MSPCSLRRLSFQALFGLVVCILIGQVTPAQGWTGPDFGPAYSDQWHDGNAELAGYQLTYPRYGQLRQGSAVAIFVSEPHQPSTGIKPERPGTDALPAFKLNLVEDFPTGVYDYNMMTSAFVSTVPHDKRPAGSLLKTSFSSAEWCGHVYQQVRFSDARAHHVSHSYFEGEADVDAKLSHPQNAFAEDALLLWARGLAGPQLEPGQSTEIPLLRASAYARLRHLPVEWDTATLTRQSGTKTIRVPAGSFEVGVSPPR